MDLTVITHLLAFATSFFLPVEWLTSFDVQSWISEPIVHVPATRTISAGPGTIMPVLEGELHEDDAATHMLSLLFLSLVSASLLFATLFLKYRIKRAGAPFSITACRRGIETLQIEELLQSYGNIDLKSIDAKKQFHVIETTALTELSKLRSAVSARDNTISALQDDLTAANERHAALTDAPGDPTTAAAESSLPGSMLDPTCEPFRPSSPANPADLMDNGSEDDHDVDPEGSIDDDGQEDGQQSRGGKKERRRKRGKRPGQRRREALERLQNDPVLQNAPRGPTLG